MLLRIYILKDSRPLLQKWACHVQKCKSTSYGITAPNVFLGEKIEICKTSNQISTDTYFLAKYLFFKNSKFQFGTFIKNQTHLYLFCNDIRFLYFFIWRRNKPAYLPILTNLVQIKRRFICKYYIAMILMFIKSMNDPYWNLFWKRWKFK